jgi:hypothetical protein
MMRCKKNGIFVKLFDSANNRIVRKEEERVRVSATQMIAALT